MNGAPRGRLACQAVSVTCLIVLFALFATACNSRPKPSTREVQVWRKLGSWSGSGPVSTEPFVSDTGTLRLQWEVRRERVPGAGVLKITVYSDVSGRPLLLAVDHRGPGRDTAYVNEDPRPFYLGIESANIEWSVTVDEAIQATAPFTP